MNDKELLFIKDLFEASRLGMSFGAQNDEWLQSAQALVSGGYVVLLEHRDDSGKKLPGWQALLTPRGQRFAQKLKGKLKQCPNCGAFARPEAAICERCHQPF